MKFTSTPPTEAGAYWFKSGETTALHLIELKPWNKFLELYYGDRLRGTTEEIKGLWSSRLIPLDVEPHHPK